MTLTHTAASNC